MFSIIENVLKSRILYWLLVNETPTLVLDGLCYEVLSVRKEKKETQVGREKYNTL